MKLDVDICIMTMPDLEKYHIKRSKIRDDIEYIYVLHGMGSSALTLRKGALDYYDTVFCSGPDSVAEIRQMEELYGTRQKTLVETGYPLLDQMIDDYSHMDKKATERKKILIAPSWQPDNIIDLCVEEMLDSLSNTGYEITLRPHPQQVRHQKEKFEEMQKKYAAYENIEIQTDFSSNYTVMAADLVITDWSDIAFEFAFTTLKPVLFIDTPMKIMNPEYDKIEQKPINITLRNVIGKNLSTDDVDSIALTVEELLAEEDKYRKVIETCREEHIYNIGKSRILCGKYIQRSLDN
jgi:YidC/Oxa1 family membrane protein insertase